MQHSLYLIKSNLYPKIELDIDHVINESLNELVNKSCFKRFVFNRKKFLEEAAKSADTIFKSNLIESAVGWFDYIKKELISRQVADGDQFHVLDIIKEECCMYTSQVDKLLSEVSQRQLSDQMYRHNYPIEYPSKLGCMFYTIYFCLNPQYRFNSLKSIVEDNNYKYYVLEVIKEKMDKLFEKIHESIMIYD